MFACTRPISDVGVGSSNPKCSEKGVVSLTVSTRQCCFYSLSEQNPMNQSTMSQVISINMAEFAPKQRRNSATAQFHMSSVTAADRGKNMFSMLPLLCQEQEQILHLLYFHPYGKCLPTFPGNLNCGSPLSCLKLVHLLCSQSPCNTDIAALNDQNRS